LKKEIILVGSFHFEQDEEVIRTKEKEVIELVDYLAQFNPTKVALEWEKSEESNLNELYKSSIEQYSVDEIEQVGFRLAKKLDHDQIYAVNWAGHLTQNDLNNLNNTIQDSYPDLLETMNLMNENTPSIHSDIPLIDSFRDLNTKHVIREYEKMYLSFAEVSNRSGDMVGINFLNKWMERELMIFKNTVEVSQGFPEDRILLLLGSDHLWMLRKMFEGIGWEVINPFS
jgi:hypothetical protein